MTQVQSLRVMISSRCNDDFPTDGEKLRAVRERLKAYLEGDRVLGHRGFDVWISEKEPSGGGDIISIQRCLEVARSHDLVVVLWNGHAGSVVTDSGLGICHAEALEAYNQLPRKVVVVRLGNQPDPKYDRPEDHAFSNWIVERGFHAEKATNYDELEAAVRRLVHKALLDNCRLGLHDPVNGRMGSNNHPKWNNQGDNARHRMMIQSIHEFFSRRPGYRRHRNNFETKIRDRQILVVPHALPGSFNPKRSGEYLRQMFQEDSRLTRNLDDNVIEPIHFVACNRSITEIQAGSLMPVDDPIPYDHPKYGILMTDHIHGYQAIFIRNYADPHTATMQMQQFMAWLESTIDHELIEHAIDHRNIMEEVDRVHRRNSRSPSATNRKTIPTKRPRLSDFKTVAVAPQISLPGFANSSDRSNN